MKSVNPVSKWLYLTYSFGINCLYWLTHFKEYKRAKRELWYIIESVKTVEHVSGFMNSYKWVHDKFIDWKPWVITVVARKLMDDCDGAATLGKHLFNNIGRGADLYVLDGNKGRHMIAVTFDGQYIVSNNIVLKTHGYWVDYVMNHFSGQYDSIKMW